MNNFNITQHIIQDLLKETLPELKTTLQGLLKDQYENPLQFDAIRVSGNEYNNQDKEEEIDQLISQCDISTISRFDQFVMIFKYMFEINGSKNKKKLKNKVIIYEEYECKEELDHIITVSDIQDTVARLRKIKEIIEEILSFILKYNLQQVYVYFKIDVQDSNKYIITTIANGVPK
jgi:hypothetical protein